jgi:hypothetical protein
MSTCFKFSTCRIYFLIFFFQEKREQLEAKLEMRRKQFHVLVSSLQQLQAFLAEADLENSNIIDVSLETFDDEDEDILKQPEPEPMIT